MAENEDTPQTELEAQGEAKPQEATPAPAPQETAPEVPQDGLNPKQGESLEAYAARIRNEVSWRDRQLTQQHKRIKDRDAKAIEIEQENQRLKEQTAVRTAPEQPKSVIQTPQPRPMSTGVPPDAIAAARLQLEMEQTQAKLDKNPDWPAALANLQRVGGIPQEIMNDILATDDPAHVVVALGKDMNKFTQLTELPERNRRAMLIKMGMESEQKAAPAAKPEIKKPSEAPPPRTSLPAGGSAAPPEGSFDPDADCRVSLEERASNPGRYNKDDYDAAWYALRAQQKLNSKGRPWSKQK